MGVRHNSSKLVSSPEIKVVPNTTAPSRTIQSSIELQQQQHEQKHQQKLWEQQQRIKNKQKPTTNQVY
jgi:hypothetical protein